MARVVNLILTLTHSYSYHATVTYIVVLTLGLLTLVFSAQRQSPINIVTGATLQNANLDPLTFNNQYQPEVQVSGIFQSTGTTVSFVPNPNEPAAILTIITWEHMNSRKFASTGEVRQLKDRNTRSMANNLLLRFSLSTSNKVHLLVTLLVIPFL